MFLSVNCYKKTYKAVALAVVCLFLTNEIAFSQSLRSLRPDTSALAPALRSTSAEFHNSFIVAEICRHVESSGSFADKKLDLGYVSERLKAYRNPQVTISVLPYEIIIEIPSEGLAVRYFDPVPEGLKLGDPDFPGLITPYSDLSRLSTAKIGGGRLIRQIIHRIKAVDAGDIPLRDDTGASKMSYNETSPQISTTSLNTQKIIQRDIKNILLINASLSGRGLDIRPPFGLWRIKAFLEREFKNSINVEILDLAIEGKDFDIENYIKNKKFDLYGISTSCSFYAPIAENLTKCIRKVEPDSLIVAGGIHASVAPIEVVQKTPVDFLVAGEGELTFRDVIREISFGDGDVSRIKGLWYLNDMGEATPTGVGLRPDLNSLPIGLPETFKNVVDKYEFRSRYFKDEPAWQMMTSLGCSTGCRFCSVGKISGIKIRYMSPERIIEEMKFVIRNYGIRNFNFDDDFFLFSLKRVKRIMNYILKDPELSGIRFKITTRADSVTDDIMKLMARAGLVHISFGIESPEDKVIEDIGKRIEVDTFKHATAVAQKYGIRVRHLLMVGLPKQDRGSIDKTIQFLKEAKPDEIFATIYTPFPGTVYSEDPERYGFYMPREYAYSNMIMREVILEEGNKEPALAIPTRWMTGEEIIRSRERILQEYEKIEREIQNDLLNKLLDPAIEKRRAAAKRLLFTPIQKSLSSEEALAEMSRSLVNSFKARERAVIALAAAAATGKFTFIEKNMTPYIRSLLNVENEQIVFLDDNDYLWPAQERRGDDYLQKFDLTRWFDDIKALQNGKIIYKPVYDRRREVKSRVRMPRDDVLRKIRDTEATLVEGTKTIYRLTVDPVPLRGRVIKEAYVDISVSNNSMVGQVDILEKVDPHKKIIIVKGTIALLDPDLNKAYDETIFLDSDFNTRLIRAVIRNRGGLAGVSDEGAFIQIMKDRIRTEDEAYILPTKAAARIIIDNKISKEELKYALLDKSTEVRTSAESILHENNLSSISASNIQDPVTQSYYNATPNFPAANIKYIDKNKELFKNVLGEDKPDRLLRIPVEAIESVGADNICAFLGEFQKAPNGYVRLYYMSGTGEASEALYKIYGLEKKTLPKGFVQKRENTVTLFPAFKGKEVDQPDIVSRIGGIGLRNTIFSPIGLQRDQVGLVRATIFGLNMMEIARKLEQDEIKASEINDRIQEVLEQYKLLCDPKTPFSFTSKDLADIAGLITGDPNRVIRALNKLIKLLPIEPINTEELFKIYEHAKKIMSAA